MDWLYAYTVSCVFISVHIYLSDPYPHFEGGELESSF